MKSEVHNTDNIFEITPDTSLWMKLGKAKYTIPKALSELIDNSIDSRLNDQVNVDIDFQIDGDYIGILDNGSGMSSKDLKKALTIAYHDENSQQIGEYGFGLKSATSYLGKELYIYTKKADADEYIKFYYDENEFINQSKWNVEYNYITREELLNEINFEFEHGTYILVKDLNVKLYKRLISENDKNGILIPKFSRIYRLFLKNQKLNLNLHVKSKMGNKINIIKIEPYDFDNFTTKINFDFKIEGKGKILSIEGWAGILPFLDPQNSSINKDVYKYSGFLVSKRNKIILENELIGYNFHPEKRLIVGEVELPDFEALNNKSDFVRNSDWQILEKIMKRFIVNPLAFISNTTFNRKFREAYDSNQSQWLNNDIDINQKLNSVIYSLYQKQIESFESDFKLEIEPYKILDFNINVEEDVFNNYIKNIDEFRIKSNQYENVIVKEQQNDKIVYEKVDSKYKKQEVYTNKSKETEMLIKIQENKNENYYDIKFNNLRIIHEAKCIDSSDQFSYRHDDEEIIYIISNKNMYNDKVQSFSKYCIDNIINAVLEYKIIIISKQMSIDREIFSKIRRECNEIIDKLNLL